MPVDLGFTAISNVLVGSTAASKVFVGSKLAWAAADPYLPYVVALLHCGGSNGSTTFVDSSPLAANWTAVGTAQISTAQSKFGGTAASFPASTDKLTATAAASNFAFGTGDFTIEAWVYVIGTAAGNQIIYDSRGSSTFPPLIYLNPAATSLIYAISSTTVITASVSVIGGWHHVAVARSGTSTKLFLDGTQVGSTYTDTTAYNSTSGQQYIGNTAAGTGKLNGYIDEFRITKGVARYTANFTSPSAAFPS